MGGRIGPAGGVNPDSDILAKGRFLGCIDWVLSDVSGIAEPASNLMAITCIRHTELPHTTSLFADLVYHFDRVRNFYAYPPYSDQSLAAAAEQVRVDPVHRALLVEALGEENRDSGEAALNNLDRLSRPGTVVVASGQQVGFYTGPIFTIYKALSAARLAEEMTRRGISAVPVFWLATEDHDLEEINHAWVFDASNQPVKLQAGASPEPNQPVGNVRVEHDGAGLRDALDGLSFGEEISRLATEAYAGPATFGSGFKKLLRRLLAPHGVLLLDPMAPAMRRLAAPLMARAIQNAPELTAALLSRGRELQDAGYHVQVHTEEKTSLFFLIQGTSRTHLRRVGDQYEEDGASHSAADLLKRLEQHPEEFSPNALLRPVVQDYLLPTAAYIGGPAELAYLAQAEVLYRGLLERMPVALPRACFTLLDARAGKLLSRYELNITDIFHGAAALEQKIADSLIPEPLERTFQSSRGEVEGALAQLDEQLRAYDPTLAAALGKSRQKIEYQFAKIHAKVGRENLRRAERARADAGYLMNLIFPHRTLQERFYSVLPFLARHGLHLMDRLHASVRFDCPDHQVLVV